MLANVDKRLLSVRAAWNALVPVVLADAATIALDLNTGIHFTVTLAGNRTLGAPTNGKPGQEGFIRVAQDTTGARALSFAAAYKFPDLATAPSLNAAANAVTLLRYHVSATGEVFLSGGKPPVSKRVQTLTSIGQGAVVLYFADVAQTVSYNIRAQADGGTGSLEKWSAVAGGTGYFNTSSSMVVSGAANGTSGTVALNAGETLSFYSNGNYHARCNIVQQ